MQVYSRRVKSFMLNSHLPRAPCDKLMYDLLYDFRHRMYLQATAYVFTYGGCAVIVRKSCYVGAVVVRSPQPLHRNHTELVQVPYRDNVEMVR